MTLDEAIKNEEENAIQQIEKANALDNIPLFGMSKDDIEEIKECYKRSKEYEQKEYEQLAEWLKELKQLRESTGYWIFVDEAHEHARCSKCDYGDVDLMDGKSHNYCQNCGAKMYV